MTWIFPLLFYVFKPRALQPSHICFSMQASKEKKNQSSIYKTKAAFSCNHIYSLSFPLFSVYVVDLTAPNFF